MSLSRSDGFVALAQSNTVTRDAALLRASTDLFVQVPDRNADEVRRFCELAIHFLAKVETRHRAYVAECLADRPDAPKVIILHLAKDTIEVAAPVLRHSPVLDGDDLLAVIAATGTLHQRLIARRGKLPPTVVLALTKLKDPAIDVALADVARPATQPLRSEAEAFAEPVMRTIDEDETDRGAVAFLALERPQRLHAIARQAAKGASASRPASTGAVLDRLVRRAYHAADIAMMARTGKKGDLIRAFAEGLSLEPGLVNRLVVDEAGEGLVLMCRAMGLGDLEARQVLLLANPHVGRSTESFYRLADLHAGMERAVAERIIATWRDESPRVTGHQPIFADTNRREEPKPAVTTRPAFSQRRQSEAG